MHTFKWQFLKEIKKIYFSILKVQPLQTLFWWWLFKSISAYTVLRPTMSNINWLIKWVWLWIWQWFFTVVLVVLSITTPVRLSDLTVKLLYWSSNSENNIDWWFRPLLTVKNVSKLHTMVWCLCHINIKIEPQITGFLI